MLTLLIILAVSPIVAIMLYMMADLLLYGLFINYVMNNWTNAHFEAFVNGPHCNGDPRHKAGDGFYCWKHRHEL